MFDNAVNSDSSDCRKEDNSKPLPNPREISRRCFENCDMDGSEHQLIAHPFFRFHRDEDRPSSRLSLLATQLGQFLDHDLTFTPESSVSERCCQDGRLEEEDCMPIPPFGPSSSCINFGRSSAFCLEPGRRREQMNTLTAFVDASHTYGSSDEEARQLRQGNKGLLRVKI